MKKRLLILFAAFLIILTLYILYFCYKNSTKLSLKCEISGEYHTLGKSYLDASNGEIEKSEDYFFIDLKNKTINDINWKKLENYKDIAIDKTNISFTYEIISNDEYLPDRVIYYSINRKLGTIDGDGESKHKKLNYTTYYTYSGTCTPYKVKQKF